MSARMSTLDSLEQTWSKLNAGVDLIMTRMQDGMSYKEYMDLYTAVYNYCSSSGVSGSAPPPDSSRTGARLMGADLYRKVENYFHQHLVTVRAASQSLTGHALLRYYAAEWTRYTTGASYVNRLFTYLNRYWIKREKDNGKRSIYTVYILALVQWKAHFYDHLQSDARLTRALLDLIASQRNGEVIETDLMKKTIDSLVALGLDEHDQSRQNLEIYRSAFETPFIAETEAYYSAESTRFLASNAVTDYMRKASARLLEEETRVDLYLHATTKAKLVSKCEETLVKRHASILQDAFPRLLEQDARDDLARTYALLARITHGLDVLKTAYEAFVRSAGLAAVEKIAEDGLDPGVYVHALLGVHARNTALVAVAFRGDQAFTASLDRAARAFINANAACTSPSRSPELLAKYTDSLLRKSSKADTDDAALARSLADAMTVFKYLDDKDVFQKFYSKMLARRLIHGTSASDDAEATMIAQLKDACGFEYTNKLQRMFQDMALNKDLNEQFRERCTTMDVDFHVLVLGTASWPLGSSPSDLQLPTELLRTYERFEAFYMDKHSGRKLTWLWQLSRNELRTLYTPAPYFFMTSTFQAAVLLQFNGADTLSFSDLQVGTGIRPDTLRPILALLCRQRVLLAEDETYSLNMGFRSKKIRVPLNATIKAEQKAETTDVLRHVDEDRKLLIQAVIVRIMKSRKTMKHQNLVAEAIDQLKNRFHPKVPDVKKAIDQLLDKEYIERMEGQRDVYSYLA